jgi:response regulator RpfG family c-di-GMP phosphodiesterase
MEQNDIAIIMADHRMPGMSGSELLEKVRQEYPSTVRLIVSGFIDQKLLMNAINKLQVHGVLTKPWMTDELQLTIKRWIEYYEKSRELDEKAKQMERLQRQLEEANKTLAQSNEHHNVIVTQLMKQVENQQKLLEYYQSPWWKRWSRKQEKVGLLQEAAQEGSTRNI